MKAVSTLTRGILFAVALPFFLWMEQRRPLRRATSSKLRRLAINLALAGFSAGLLRLLLLPPVLGLAAYTSEMRLGLLHLAPLPGWLHLALSLVLLDYTLYVWHWLNHRAPFLWRFHQVHHTDLDMDVSTASRFHFGELTLSALFRSGQILAFGCDPFSLTLFETMVLATTQFHHSNLRLPLRMERSLVQVVVTPRMHGIHHSVVRGETNSNFSTIFSFWDKLHRTLRLNVSQEALTIGLPAYRRPEDLGFLSLLVMPFRAHRASFQFADGSRPERLQGASGNLSLLAS